jgi:hypothetical protein
LAKPKFVAQQRPMQPDLDSESFLQHCKWHRIAQETNPAKPAEHGWR